MNEIKNESDLETALLEHLSDHKLEKKTLNALSAQFITAYKHGMKMTDWHILGQPPRIDQIIINGTVQGSNAAGLGRLASDSFWKELKIFRKGIPKPDYFEVELTIRPQKANIF
jgi:antitoxin component HigA of HigAB toxin-antitoxin module